MHKPPCHSEWLSPVAPIYRELLTILPNQHRFDVSPSQVYALPEHYDETHLTRLLQTVSVILHGLRTLTYRQAKALMDPHRLTPSEEDSLMRLAEESAKLCGVTLID